MKNPVTALTRNLVFTRHGTVWATWRLAGRPYGMKPTDEKRLVRALHTGLYRSVPGEMLLMGLTSPIGPASVVGATIKGVDLDRCLGAVEEAEANLDRLAGVQMGQRVFYASVPLANIGADLFMEPARASLEEFRVLMAMSRGVPSRERIEARMRQAEQIRRRIPFSFEAVPVSVQEHLWIFNHACVRGIPDGEVPREWSKFEVDQSVVRLSAMPAPVLDVAGQTEMRGARDKVNPLGRRFLKVETFQGASYQTSLVVSGTPPDGLAFPGGEWLANLDLTGQRVDWAQRVTVRGAKDVARRNLKALRNLNDQADQRSVNESAYLASGGLKRQMADLVEYASLLEADKTEMETESTTILTLSGQSREEMEDAARIVEQVMGPTGWGFSLSREPGVAQEDLWWASLPGAPTSRVVRSLAQVAPSRSLSVAVPVTTTQVGDHYGVLLAMIIGGGVLNPVLVDLESAAKRLNVSPSLAVVGELGSGKSVTLKTLAILLADRGSHVVAIDRSETAEWVMALSSVEGLKVVDISDQARVSLDPLRVLDESVCSQYAQNLLQALLGIAATSSQAGLLGEVLEPTYRREHGLGSLMDVVDHLGSLEGEMALDMCRRLRSFARKPLTKVVFDRSLPALDVEAPAIVFRTQSLSLPEGDELASPHRFNAMSIEKVFSRAVYAQLVGIARMICFANRTRLDVFVADEAHALTLSDESTRDLEYLVRDGRKHLGGLLMGSHDPKADFGSSEVLRRLISYRLLMRHRDDALARRALEWLGLDPRDEELVKMVCEDLSPIPEGAKVPDPARLGEALMRDARGQVGQIKVVPPAASTRGQDVMSTPVGELA